MAAWTIHRIHPLGIQAWSGRRSVKVPLLFSGASGWTNCSRGILCKIWWISTLHRIHIKRTMYCAKNTMKWWLVSNIQQRKLVQGWRGWWQYHYIVISATSVQSIVRACGGTIKRNMERRFRWLGNPNTLLNKHSVISQRSRIQALPCTASSGIWFQLERWMATVRLRQSTILLHA